MSNCAIHVKGSDKIEQFVTDAIVIKKSPGIVDIIGTGGKRTGVKLALFDLLWTDDIATPVLDEEGHQTGYDKTVPELATDGENLSITVPERATYHRAVRLRKFIADMTEHEVVDHVQSVFGGLKPVQQQSLTCLYLAVWGQVQMDGLRK